MFAGQALPCAPGTFRLPASRPPAAWAGLPLAWRRISEHIGIRYDDFALVRPVVEQIREYLMNHDGLDTTQTTMVHFNVYGPHSLDIMVYCFTRTTVWTTYHEVREAVLLGIGEIIERNGAEIAFPTRTLKVEMAEA